MFRDARLRRGGIYETMAILVLRIARDKKPVTADVVERFRAIYEEMKRHHWWLTGPNDFPACAMLVAQGPNGQRIPVRVHEVSGEQITLDMNHPLAGQSLTFDVKILAIDEATPAP